MKKTIESDSNDLALQDIQSLLEMDKNEEAVTAVSNYLKKWPFCDTLAILFGEALMRMGELDTAKTTIEQGLNIDGYNFELYFMLSQYYESLENIQAAIICCRYAIFLCDIEADSCELQAYYTNLLEKHKDIRPLKTTVILSPGINGESVSDIIKLIESYNPADSYEVMSAGFDSYNSGIEKSDSGSDILILEEHVYLLPHTLFQLQLSSVTWEAAGILSPLIFENNDKSEEKITLDTAIGYAKENSWKKSINCKSCVYLNSSAFYIKNSVLKSCGRLEQKFKSLEYQISDLGFRAMQQGYTLYQVQGVCFKAETAHNTFYVKEEQQKFYESWQVTLSYSCFARNDILKQMPPESENDLRILEIGCACGATLLALKERFADAAVYGIELDEGPASIAQNFADVRVGNIESMPLEYDENFFDYIIFGDVLEHLYDPQKVLIKVKPFLRKGGRIIASLPNVMHISVVRNLLEGHWNYEDAGILDKTHLRFFTCESARNLFKDTGYQEESIAATQTLISSDDEKMIYRLSSIGDTLPDYFRHYQYIIQAKKYE